MVVPSRLTKRRPRYQAPCVPGSASGRATRANSSLSGVGPSRVRALVIADLSAGARSVPPAHALEQAAQDLAVGGLGIQGQGDDVVDHQPCRQLPLALLAGV